MSDEGQEAMQALRDEAVAWLVRVQSDAATAEDWAALTAWLEGSEDRLQAFEDAELILADVDNRREEIDHALPAPAARVTEFRRPPRRSRTTWISGAIAAGLALAVATPWLWTRAVGVTTTYQTAPGETRTVNLADGSQITLDGASKLSVRLGWRTRKVEMGLAQASFDVAKDPSRPFLIDAGDEQVRVVGTQFNINHEPNRLRVTVRRGVVQVRPLDGRSEAVRLTVGQELRHTVASGRDQIVAVQPDGAFAWSRGQLVADNETLAEVVASLNRRHKIQVRLSTSAAAKRFTGVLSLDDQDSAVRVLAAAASLTVVRSGNEIILR